VSDFNGGSNYIFGQQIICSNAAIFNEFQAIVAEYMNFNKQ
jgi:myo-inositol-1(or 4)-monophosphatase